MARALAASPATKSCSRVQPAPGFVRSEALSKEIGSGSAREEKCQDATLRMQARHPTGFAESAAVPALGRLGRHYPKRFLPALFWHYDKGGIIHSLWNKPPSPLPASTGNLSKMPSVATFLKLPKPKAPSSAILSRNRSPVATTTSCRARKAILRARDGKLARFREPINRNTFLVACRDYTDEKREEHLLIGYGFRHGSTTKVESLHHVIGGADSFPLPDAVAHGMWDYYWQDEDNELLIFHNHPYNPLNFLLDNPPLPSRKDRLSLEARALNPEQLVRRTLGQGRVLFYLGENGYVKEFRLPSILALIERRKIKLLLS